MCCRPTDDVSCERFSASLCRLWQRKKVFRSQRWSDSSGTVKKATRRGGHHHVPTSLDESQRPFVSRHYVDSRTSTTSTYLSTVYTDYFLAKPSIVEWQVTTGKPTLYDTLVLSKRQRRSIFILNNYCIFLLLLIICPRRAHNSSEVISINKFHYLKITNHFPF